MAVSDYSTTAGDNTAISGITVTDATVADQLDNIIRQMMADTKAFYDAQFMVPVAYARYNAPTVVDSYGFSGVTKNGVGDYTFTFSSAQADTNYVVQSTILTTTADSIGVTNTLTTSFDIAVLSNAAAAVDRVIHVSVWRSLL